MRYRSMAPVALLAAIALFAATVPLSAQATGRVTGRVLNASTNRPLAGAQVFVVGTNAGGLTDANGRYLILNVPAGSQQVRAELVGYRAATQPVTVAADQVVTLDFELEETAIALEEIVVTGAGVATEKKRLGNTIATIDASKVAETAPVANLSQVLQGREPGVAVLPSSGTTGEGARIRIRGAVSLSQPNEPIIYVDGVRVDREGGFAGFNEFAGGQGNPSKLDDIPPEAIERIEVLKGAAAATLYGSEASAGVIQIFTKRGRSGTPRFTFQMEQSAIDVPTDRMLPIADFPRTQAEIDRMRNRFGVTLQPFQVFQVDLLPRFFETGHSQAYSASVTGGGDLFTYFVSGRWTDEDGPMSYANLFDPAIGLTAAEDHERRLQANANLSITPHEKVRINVSTQYAELDFETPDNSNNIYGVFSSGLMAQLRLANETNEWGAPAFATTRENWHQFSLLDSNHFTGSLNANYRVTDDIALDATAGIDFVNEAAIGFRPFRWNVDDFSSSTPDGSRFVSERRNRVLTADFKGSWTAQFTDRISSQLTGGFQGFLSQDERQGGGSSDFPGPGISVVGAGSNQSVFENWERVVNAGVYLQDQLGWSDYLFLTLGGRWDANSAFGENFETAFYPKASVSFIPTDAFGWSSDLLSTLRVRGAIGRSGLQPGAFDKFTTFSPLPSPEGPGLQPANLGNDDLRPEVATEWEVGAEAGLFNDRFSIELTYWDRTTEDALVPRQFPVTGGFVSTQLDNIGEVVAQGFDVGVQGTVLQLDNFSINAFANGAYISQEITDMGGAPPLKTGGSYPRYRNFLVEGFTPGAFFGAEVADVDIPLNLDGSCTVPTREQALAYFSQPRNPSSFKPLAVGNADFGQPDGTLASHNCGNGLLLSYLGKPTPDWQGAFGFSASFLGNFELNTLFEYKAGNYFVQDLSGMFRRANSFIGRNTPRAAQLAAIMQNPASTAEQRLDAAIAWANEIEGLSPMSGMNGVFPADFVRFRELSLTYNLPTEFIGGFGLESAAISLGARNLALWVNDAYTGMDPEGNVLGRCLGSLDCNFLDSTEGWGVPIPRRYTIMTRVSF